MRVWDLVEPGAGLGSPVAPGIRVLGSGPVDLLFIPDGLLPIAALPLYPPYRRFLDDLAQIGRLVLFDRRGIGALPWRAKETLGWAHWATDAAHALDAAGSTRAIVVAVAEGALTAMAFADRYADRVAGLVLVNPTPGHSVPVLTREGAAAGYIDWLRGMLDDRWVPEVEGVEVIAPSAGRDLGAWLRHAFTLSGRADRLRPAFELALRSDARASLSGVTAPVLVVHRRSDRWIGVRHGRYLADAVPHARYVELPGGDHLPYLGDSVSIVSAIRWFVDDLQPKDAAGTVDGARLTPRQRALLARVADGATDRDIAAEFGLSVRTVQKHLQRAYRTLGVHNRTAAARRYAAAETGRVSH